MLKNTRIGALINALSGVNEVDLWLNAGNDFETRDVIADLQREQLQRGERPDGSSFDNYSEVSVEVYGKPAGAIKWFDSGYFYENIDPTTTETEINMGQAITIDEFGDELNLETDNNEQILGIQENNLEPIQEQFKNKYIEQLRDILDDY